MLVDDGAIVVLGGLLQDEYAGNEQKVTGIGDVPLLGRLFKSETRSRKKTNLMVFLRPVVVRDAARGDELTLDRYELMRLKQQAAQPVPSSVMPVNAAPVLPPYPPPAARPPAAPPAAAPPQAGPVPLPTPVPAPRPLQPVPLPPAADRE